MKTSSAVQAIFSKEYIRFDERGRKKYKPKPFLKPAMEIAVKKIFRKRKGGRKMKSNVGYDYKKIVEEFEKWLKEDFCNKEIRGPVHFSEHKEVQDKFLAIKRKHMLLK